ncbi:MAG TPA: helix-turn-helix transcriptional regulator [Actinomycetota bacterium]|jgi:transcriptional regulator with XRE-family HTH domain
MSNVTSLAERLKANREARGISQSQAARELDVARTAYRLWELEAARPAPDRWRLVARWLGVSMATLLLSEGLITDEEAADSNLAAARYQASTGETQDSATERETGDFFGQGQAMIDQSLERGIFTAKEASQFRAMLRRIESGLAASDPNEGLRPAP